MKRHYIPALITIGLLATFAALELRHAYNEGRDCQQRGGVIVETDASTETSAELKLCTVDY